MTNGILLLSPLLPEEIAQLATEFPQYQLFMLDKDEPLTSLGVEICSQIEIIYGCKLTINELNLLPQLHWIHCTEPYLEGVCKPAFERKENILITTTRDENIETIGEFAISAALAFSKNLFSWKDASLHPKDLQLENLRKDMWAVKDCLFLQVGLGKIGTEIARRAKQEGYQVLGVQEVASFHPFCEKTYSLKELSTVLPMADIVSTALPRDQIYAYNFGKQELLQMKDDSVLLVFGPGSTIDIDQLGEIGAKKKFRGILLDAHFAQSISVDWPLWSAPNVIVTKESSRFPLTKKRHAFNAFLYNLRQYLHNNYIDMENLVE